MPPTDRAISSGRPIAVLIGELTSELQASRNAVVDAVLRAGCRPLSTIDDADVYLGVVGHNSEAAEREYRQAVARGIPRLVFLAADDRANPDPADRARLAAFKKQLRAENACEPFASVGELRALVTQALLELRDGRLTGSDVPAGEPLVVTVVPRPPEFYTAPPYLLQGSRFVGRRAELAALDAWAAAADSLMVVEAIGGMGKSALTWEWAQRSAETRIFGLAGRVWWSFYERGTSMKTFLRHALAYTTGRAPNDFLRIPTNDLGDQLLTVLRARPFLLVLDGFERVLAAYHRSDKAQVRDDRVPTDERECTNPRDGEVLRQLLRCAPSRVLVSTRLMPAALETGTAGSPLPGVRHLVLEGLAHTDALEMARAANVRGDDRAILDFADQFDRHPLLLRIACGLVSDYPSRPGDFDAWAADPAAGGALRLTDLAAGHRYAHLLEYAFRALDAKTRQVLSRIAVLSDAADYATVAVLNPFLPPPPKPVPEPLDPSQSFSWNGLDYPIHSASDPVRRAELESHRDAERAAATAAYQRHRRRYERYQAALRAYPLSPAYRKGMADFHAALTELEDRGLLQWDRDANTYDLHPVVRAYAFDLLEDGERVRAFSAIGDHFVSRPREDAQEATELSHLRNSVEIVRAFTGAGRGEEAAAFLRGRLSEALLFTVGAHHTLIELLTPLLGVGRNGTPLLSYWKDRSYSMNNLAIALNSVGRIVEAKTLYTDAARLDLEAGDLFNLETGLRSLARCVQRANQLYLGERILDLCRALARATNDQHGMTAGLLDRLAIEATFGRINNAERMFAAFQRQSALPRHMYRPGAAEYHLALARFYEGKLVENDLARGERLAADGRGVQNQHAFAALRAEWELTRDNPTAALDAVEVALSVVRRTGEAAPDYMGLRSHALARLGREADALDALAEAARGWDGHLPRFPFHAAEALLVIGDAEAARDHLLHAHRCAWADGPPYAHRYYLGLCRERMEQLRIAEPRLSEFRATAAEAVPFEAEILAAIAGVEMRRPKVHPDDMD